MEVENIDEFDQDDELATTTTTILPKKKDKEHSKIVDHNIDEEPCPSVKVEEIMIKVVRLKPVKLISVRLVVFSLWVMNKRNNEVLPPRFEGK